MKPPRSELAFASFLSYCPRGDTDEMKKAKNFVLLLKENRASRLSGGRVETASARVARRLIERDVVADITAFLGRDTVLVPVPRSGLRKRHDLWPALEIAESLHAKRFWRRSVALSGAEARVPKAATAKAEERPKARTHLDSLDVADPLSLPAHITLVDDVVTRGAQLFGAAWKIWSVRPDVEVRAFAVVRTESDAADFRTLFDPRTGRIECRDEECRRRP